jgi:hypothetical protein
MKVLFQNDTVHTAYIGWTDYLPYRELDTPKVLVLLPESEVLIDTTERYYLSVRINETYLFDAKLAMASKVVILEETGPFVMFYYDFDIVAYQQYQPHIRHGHSIDTWRAHYVQGDMINKIHHHYYPPYKEFQAWNLDDLL